MGPNGRPCCRQCGTEVKPPRRTFCSAACVHEWKVRTSSSYAKRQVYLRDKGVCKSCQIDTKVVAAELWEIRLLQGEGQEILTKRLHGIPASRKVWRRKYGGGLWDLDHIVPVKDGGGSCGIENMQTLCIPCHRTKTTRCQRASTR